MPAKSSFRLAKGVLPFAAALAYVLFFRFRFIDNFIYLTHEWRQSESIMMIDAYYRYGIDLLKPMVAWKGEYRVHPFEFPLFEAIAALVYKVFSPQVLVAKSVFLVLFGLGLFYLYRLVTLFGGSARKAWAALFLYAAMPMSLYYSVLPQVDFATTTFCIGAVYYLEKYLQGKSRMYLVAFGLSLTIVGLEKPPYLLSILPLALYLLWARFEWRTLLNLLLATFPAGVLSVAWIVYSQELIAQTPDFSFLPDFSLKDHDASWYFGTWEQRKELGNIRNMLDRLEKGVSYPIGVLALAGIGLAATEPTKENKGWLWLLAGQVLMVAVFFNLNLIHDYYQIPMVFAAAMLGATALERLYAGAWPLAVLVMLWICYSNPQFTKDTAFTTNEVAIEYGKAINENSTADSLMLFANHNTILWNDPTMQGYSRRYGFNISTESLSPKVLDGALRNHAYILMAINQYGPFPDGVDRRVRLYRSVVTPLKTKLEFYHILP